MDASVVTIPAKSVISLDFDGDEVVDWCGGGRTFSMDGSVRERRVFFGFPFDATAVSPSRE